MTKGVITEEIKQTLKKFLAENPQPELVNTYLCFIEKNFNLHPVLFPKEKMIYQSPEDAVAKLEVEGKIWHKAEIKIGTVQEDVNEQTKKIYICPFTGKVYGDNTHPNPQDAIYDWVSKCPENTERTGGLRVKRFYVSEDPEVISSYMSKNKPKEPITKTVFSSVVTGKLFGSKEAVIEDFKKNHLKPMTLLEVQSQNRFKIEDGFLALIQGELVEEKISGFVEGIAEIEDFQPIVQVWIGTGE